MPRFVPTPPRKIIKILQTLGFAQVRVRGSHHFFFNPGTKKTTTVPIHGNENLSVGLIKEILKDIELSAYEYEKLRKKI